MFSIFIFLILLNFTVLYKNFKKLYDYLNNDNFSSDIHNISSNLNKLMKEIFTKIKIANDNILETYTNLFDQDENENNFVDENVNFNKFLKQFDHYKKFKYIIYQLNEKDNDLQLLNNIITFCNENNLKLFIFGFNNLDSENKSALDELLITNNEKFTYLTNKNFTSTIFGYITLLNDFKTTNNPWTDKITEKELLDQLTKYLNINKDDITYLNEDIFKNWEKLY